MDCLCEFHYGALHYNSELHVGLSLSPSSCWNLIFFLKGRGKQRKTIAKLMHNFATSDGCRDANRKAVTVVFQPSCWFLFFHFFEANISESPWILSLMYLIFWAANSSSEELATARLGCGTNFSFHVCGFVARLTNPHSTEEPPKQQGERRDHIHLHASLSRCMVNSSDCHSPRQ